MESIGGAPRILRRDMSASVDEFVRGLRAAFPGSLEGTGNLFRASEGGVTMEIEFSIGPTRRIALLALPTLAVTIRFPRGDAAACTALLAHLDRYLHRGGG